jgi:NAD(P)-dependent dehydrogenase (short-subunit alcohol dehydrogenase family)
VNAVSPGPIATPIFTPDKLGIPQQAIESMGESVVGLVPLKRFGQPIEVAEVIAFVGSPAASYVNGAEYSVGGGIEAS